MIDFSLYLTAWHWIGLAALLLILEVLSGTGFLLWLGISASLVGCLLFAIKLALEAQLIIFAMISIMVALIWFIYLHYHPIKTEDPKLNKRVQQYIGRAFTLEFPIINGMGRIHIDDSMWRIKCNKDLPIGAKIIVIKGDGVILIVEPLAE